MTLAVLDFNLKEDIYDYLNEQLGLDIPGDCLQKLNDIADYGKKRRFYIAQEEFKKIRNRNLLGFVFSIIYFILSNVFTLAFPFSFVFRCNGKGLIKRQNKEKNSHR